MEPISVLCEVQSQLRVANVYLKTAKFLKYTSTYQTNSSDNCLFIKSEDDQIVMKFPPTINLLNNYDIIASHFDDNYIHIRMPYGVPKGEISGSENVEVLHFASILQELSINFLKIYVPVAENQYRVHCATCSTALVNAAQFKRVLPMPRTSWCEAVSDWYCHRHGDEPANQTLQPRSTDCLYGSCYYVLPETVYVDGCIKSSDSQVACSNCNSTIGVVIDKRLTIWAHSIQWSLEEADHLTQVDVPTHLESFYSALCDALTEENSFVGRKVAFKDPTDDSAAIMLWFIGDKCETLKGSIETQSNIIEMRPTNMRRVLYRQIDKSAKIPSDVCEYLASEKMIRAALCWLRSSSEQLPASLRSAAGFSIGYLELDKKY